VERVSAPSGGRESFGTRAGFILAAAGSAIGLGNMWRFPYLASEGGGATFVLMYIVFTMLVGIPLLLAEFAIGRRGQGAPVASMRALGGRRWGRVGLLFVAAGLFILSYYSVIAGWTLRYALDALLGDFAPSAADRFGEISSGTGAVAFHVGFMAITTLVVVGGVKAGIERTSLLLMPALFVIVVGLAIWAATLPGAHAGYLVYLSPDLDEITNPAIWRAAASQALFSLSLGMGGMLTFASYLRRDQNLPESGTVVAFSDFGVAFTAGLMVFPLIHSLGLQAAVGESTVGALFIALPGAFASMGSVGRVVGLFFFVVLAVGALTSAISLLEVVTASLMDEFRLPRRAAATGAGVVIAVLGVFPALDIGVLGLMDKIAGELLLLAGALAIAIFAGWRASVAVQDELRAGASRRWQACVRPIVLALRWLVPPIVAVALFSSMRETLAAVGAFLAG